MADKKCNCGHSRDGKCINCSKIKMVVGLKREYYHLKKGEKLPVFYCFLKENKLDDHLIIERMTNRLRNHLKGKCNAIIFYNNLTKEQIKSINGEDF